MRPRVVKEQRERKNGRELTHQGLGLPTCGVKPCLEEWTKGLLLCTRYTGGGAVCFPADFLAKVPTACFGPSSQNVTLPAPSFQSLALDFLLTVAELAGEDVTGTGSSEEGSFCYSSRDGRPELNTDVLAREVADPTQCRRSF